MTIEELLARYERGLRNAFLESIKDITSRAQIGQITRALEQGDINAAVEAIFVDRAAYAKFEALIEEAYGEGGIVGIEDAGDIRDTDGQRTIIRFNGRNLRAERILREHSSNMVTNIIREQRQGIREHLTAGMEAGNNPRSTALNVVGRIDRASQRRTGGIIGLNLPQQRAVLKAREQLESGDFSAFKQRKLRDKRFDSVLNKAAIEGRSLTADEVNRIIARYNDRLLKLRGVTIGRTESLTALNMGAYQAMQQIIDSGKVDAENIEGTWDSAGDLRVRFSHAVVDGKKVRFGQSWVMPSGVLMKHPGDPAGGGAEVINCRCVARWRINYRPNR